MPGGKTVISSKEIKQKAAHFEMMSLRKTGLRTFKFMTNLSSVYAGRASVAEGGIAKKEIFCLHFSPMSEPQSSVVLEELC